MGEGDILNSTTNVPQASSIDRFSNMNPDRCVSNPQIDLIGFTDDITGDQLEARTRTRSRRLIHDEDLDEHHSTKVSMEGCGIKEVFEDESTPIDAYPNPRKRVERNLSRISQRDRTRNTEPVLACGLEPLRVHSPAVLSHHQGVSACKTLGRRKPKSTSPGRAEFKECQI